LLIVIGLAVHADSAHKPAARRFIDYIVSHETLTQVRHQTLNLPSIRSAAESVEAEPAHRPYRFHMYREMFHTFRTYADLGLNSRQLSTVRSELRYYWSGLEPLETVMKRLEKRLLQEAD